MGTVPLFHHSTSAQFNILIAFQLGVDNMYNGYSSANVLSELEDRLVKERIESCMICRWRWKTFCELSHSLYFRLKENQIKMPSDRDCASDRAITKSWREIAGKNGSNFQAICELFHIPISLSSADFLFFSFLSRMKWNSYHFDHFKRDFTLFISS